MGVYQMKCELEEFYGYDWNVLDMMDDWEIEEHYREHTSTEEIEEDYDD